MDSFVGSFLPKMLKNSSEVRFLFFFKSYSFEFNLIIQSKNKQTNGNSGRLLKTGDDTKLIIDLDYVVEKFIMYMNNETKEGKIKNYDDVEILVNWKHVVTLFNRVFVKLKKVF